MSPDEIALRAASQKLDQILKYLGEVNTGLRGMNINNYPLLPYELRKKVYSDLNKVALKAENLFQEHAGM